MAPYNWASFLNILVIAHLYTSLSYAFIYHYLNTNFTKLNFFFQFDRASSWVIFIHRHFFFFILGLNENHIPWLWILLISFDEPCVFVCASFYLFFFALVVCRTKKTFPLCRYFHICSPWFGCVTMWFDISTT